ncbi:hypothetical protein EDD15DRAFT_1063763 [Pisolithus albus]|nr:hypothetical protein EDD15DRAFT_1063763 [Pisolithus albus]
MSTSPDRPDALGTLLRGRLSITPRFPSPSFLYHTKWNNASFGTLRPANRSYRFTRGRDNSSSASTELYTNGNAPRSARVLYRDADGHNLPACSRRDGLVGYRIRLLQRPQRRSGDRKSIYLVKRTRDERFPFLTCLRWHINVLATRPRWLGAVQDARRVLKA